MEIKDYTLSFKSDDAFFFKEKAGIIPNITRFFDTQTPENTTKLNQMIEFEYGTSVVFLKNSFLTKTQAYKSKSQDSTLIFGICQFWITCTRWTPTS